MKASTRRKVAAKMPTLKDVGSRIPSGGLLSPQLRSVTPKLNYKRMRGSDLSHIGNFDNVTFRRR